jgi:hypothetical protein
MDRGFGILTPLPMVYQTPYPWYFDPPTNGILTLPTYGISNPLLWYYESLGGFLKVLRCHMVF